jgi:hypothetical protein
LNVIILAIFLRGKFYPNRESGYRRSA